MPISVVIRPDAASLIQPPEMDPLFGPVMPKSEKVDVLKDKKTDKKKKKEVFVDDFVLL